MQSAEQVISCCLLARAKKNPTHNRTGEACGQGSSSLALGHAVLFSENKNNGTSEEENNLAEKGVGFGSAQVRRKSLRPKQSPTSIQSHQLDAEGILKGKKQRYVQPKD
jgi:hypothetical protein